jgi:hypothetical protein
MKLRPLHVAFALTLTSAGFAVLRSVPAEADSGIDCSSLKKWDKSTQYKQGALVWAENNDWRSDGSEYRCEPRTPFCTGSYEPKGESQWKLVGACKSGSKPR